MVSAAGSGQRQEHNAGRAGERHDREHCPSSPRLLAVVCLLLALTLGGCSPSLGPGVLRHTAGLTQALLFVTPRCLSTAEASRLTSHEINDAIGRMNAVSLMISSRALPLALSPQGSHWPGLLCHRQAAASRRYRSARSGERSCPRHSRSYSRHSRAGQNRSRRS
jgi:hypothetical protein